MQKISGLRLLLIFFHEGEKVQFKILLCEHSYVKEIEFEISLVTELELVEI